MIKKKLIVTLKTDENIETPIALSTFFSKKENFSFFFFFKKRNFSQG